MKIFDMHCDTITTAMREKKGIYENDLQVDLKRLSEFDEAYQIFAVWLEDKYLKNAFVQTKRALEYFQNEYSCCADKCPNVTPIFAVEGGEAIENDIENIRLLKELRVKLITICWNHKNNLGCGALSGSDDGLSEFGIEAIKEMEHLGIIPDVSHLNKKGFWDLYENTKSPFVASHSNCFEVHSHLRNLDDEQIRAIAERGGMIGINLYNDFISSGVCTSENIIPHIEHLIKIGGSDVIGLGCDFDGIDKHPEDISDVSCMPVLYDRISSKFGSLTADKIFFSNAFEFFMR